MNAGQETEDSVGRCIDYVSDVLKYLGEPGSGPVRVVGDIGPERKHWLNTVSHLLRGVNSSGPTPGNFDDELVFTQFMGSFSAARDSERGSGRHDKAYLHGNNISLELDHAISGAMSSFRVHHLAMGLVSYSPQAAVNGPDAMEPMPKELVEQMQHVHSWSDFDIFRVSKLSWGRPLQTVAMQAFRDMNLVEKLSLPEGKLANFLADVEAHYSSLNQYHNSMHVADVTQGILVVLCADNCAHGLTNLEILALLMAAVIHDVNHPGVDNSYLVQAGSEEAMLYNDTSVNENGHISLGFQLLQKPENNFLAVLTNADYRQLRRIVIELVLGTDMAFHQSLLATFVTSTSILGSDLSRWKDENRTLLLKFILHSVDISNPARSWPQCLQWAKLVTEEFFCQGDRERKAGMPVSPLYDREATHPVKNQQVFCNLFVKPTFQALSAVVPSVAAHALANCAANNAHYTRMLEDGVVHLPQPPESGRGGHSCNRQGCSRTPSTS